MVDVFKVLFCIHAVSGIDVFVEDADSEKMQISISSGLRLREARSINNSLCSLGDVIWATERDKEYIPFKSSKLSELP
jgi:hypothetical protein